MSDKRTRRGMSAPTFALGERVSEARIFSILASHRFAGGMNTRCTGFDVASRIIFSVASTNFFVYSSEKSALG